MADVPIWIQIMNAYGPPLVTGGLGLILGNYFNQKRNHKKELQDRERAVFEENQRKQEAVNKSLNKVLEASYGITQWSYDPEHNTEMPIFNLDKYQASIRPLLYENYGWLPDPIKHQIYQLDQKMFHSHYSEFGPGEYHVVIDKAFDVLIQMIKTHFELVREEDV